MFEQLARYTMRNQESDLHLNAFILLQLLLTILIFLLFYLFHLLTNFLLLSSRPYFEQSSGFFAKAGHVWVN